MKIKYLLLICPALCFADPASQMMQNEPNMPMPQTIPELGVTRDQFTECCKAGKPAQRGGELNTAAIAQCLQHYNSSITSDQVESFMQSHPPINENGMN